MPGLRFNAVIELLTIAAPTIWKGRRVCSSRHSDSRNRERPPQDPTSARSHLRASDFRPLGDLTTARRSAPEGALSLAVTRCLPQALGWR